MPQRFHSLYIRDNSIIGFERLAGESAWDAEPRLKTLRDRWTAANAAEASAPIMQPDVAARAVAAAAPVAPAEAMDPNIGRIVANSVAEFNEANRQRLSIQRESPGLNTGATGVWRPEGK